jgi:hypothetical protein
MVDPPVVSGSWEKAMNRIALTAGALALVASTAAVATVANVAQAHPDLNAATNMVVATGVDDFVAAEQARIAAEQAAAEAARLAWENDMSGIGPSAYTGEYYDAGSDATRQCIQRKESTGDYTVVGGGGLFYGAYQFMQQTADTAATRAGRPDLVGVPPNQWNRHDQDMAFWVIWNHGAGRGNWPTAAGC